jgi:hypothetical protein
VFCLRKLLFSFFLLSLPPLMLGSMRRALVGYVYVAAKPAQSQKCSISHVRLWKAFIKSMSSHGLPSDRHWRPILHFFRSLSIRTLIAHQHKIFAALWKFFKNLKTVGEMEWNKSAEKLFKGDWLSESSWENSKCRTENNWFKKKGVKFSELSII